MADVLCRSKRHWNHLLLRGMSTTFKPAGPKRGGLRGGLKWADTLSGRHGRRPEHSTKQRPGGAGPNRSHQGNSERGQRGNEAQPTGRSHGGAEWQQGRGEERILSHTAAQRGTVMCTAAVTCSPGDRCLSPWPRGDSKHLLKERPQSERGSGEAIISRIASASAASRLSSI